MDMMGGETMQIYSHSVDAPLQVELYTRSKISKSNQINSSVLFYHIMENDHKTIILRLSSK